MKLTNNKAWHIGNTTVRNPMRIKLGLTVLADSPLNGNLVGLDKENAFARLLHESGVAHVARLTRDENSEVGDLGRKWRAAMMQLGFITNAPYSITGNGYRLIEGTVLPAEQECFLRSLLAYQIPSPLEHGPGPVFSPLRIVLEVLASLERVGLDATISKDEMAGIIQFVRQYDEVDAAVERIRQFREKESQAANRRDRLRLRNAYLQKVAESLKGQSANTLGDYADLTFRYLKVTGLFSSVSRLAFALHKRTIIDQILSTPVAPIPNNEYVATLQTGARLPTDDKPQAIAAIESLADVLRDKGEAVKLPELTGRPVQDLSQLRLSLEGRYTELLEMQYAEDQSNQWSEIRDYLRALGDLRNTRLVPKGEAPAYLEWSVWRAFLAIDSLSNKPWEARRFRVDQDFQPIGPAPANGPDLIFEFDDFVVVVEVTLTSSSRQEAAEGEPVRRHVARLVDEYEQRGKRVYGLFIANEIDTNTAETFKIGSWYRPDDSKMALLIVPLTIKQFADLFETGFNRANRLEYTTIKQVIRECLAEKGAEAPQWKQYINQHVQRIVQEISR